MDEKRSFAVKSIDMALIKHDFAGVTNMYYSDIVSVYLLQGWS